MTFKQYRKMQHKKIMHKLKMRKLRRFYDAMVLDLREHYSQMSSIIKVAQDNPECTVVDVDTNFSVRVEAQNDV